MCLCTIIKSDDRGDGTESEYQNMRGKKAKSGVRVNNISCSTIMMSIVAEIALHLTADELLVGRDFS